MKTWKLVSGILLIVLSVFVLFQSCAAGLSESLTETEGFSGMAGTLVALLMISSGIVSIATRSGGKGANIALAVLLVLAALIGFAGATNYPDLNIWAALCLICAALAIVAAIKTASAAPSQH